MKTSEDISIRIATLNDRDDLVPLFDEYRRFDGRESDLTACRSFLRNRLERNESHILISVAPGARRGGVGSMLLQASAEFARAHGAIRLNLSTALDDHAAQVAYEKAGWRRTMDYFEYQMKLD